MTYKIIKGVTNQKDWEPLLYKGRSKYA